MIKPTTNQPHISRRQALCIGVAGVATAADVPFSGGLLEHEVRDPSDARAGRGRNCEYRLGLFTRRVRYDWTVNASKHAIWSLTRCTSLDYAAQHIRVNMVSPGAYDTPMLERALQGFGTTKEATAAEIPIRRVTSADEIARIVLYLSSDDATKTFHRAYLASNTSSTLTLKPLRRSDAARVPR